MIVGYTATLILPGFHIMTCMASELFQNGLSTNRRTSTLSFLFNSVIKIIANHISILKFYFNAIAFYEKTLWITNFTDINENIWFSFYPKSVDKIYQYKKVIDLQIKFWTSNHFYVLKSSLHTFVESSNIFVCSAMNLTQKHDLCISGGHLECENAGFRSTGLLMSSSAVIVRSSDSDWGMGTGPWIWQLPPKGPPSAKLKHKITKLK